MTHKILFSILYIFICLPQVYAAEAILNYDEVRQRGGFNSRKMTFVTTIERKDYQELSGEELQQLVKSQTLSWLESLDLSCQENLTDEHIRQLSTNKTFSRLYNIDLSECPYITEASVDFLLNGVVGTVQKSPSYHGRYVLPCSYIYVGVYNTNQIKNYEDRKKFEVEITYDEPEQFVVTDGLKIIQFEY